MEASRLANMTMTAFSRLSRWERVAWIVRAERDLFPPPAPTVIEKGLASG